MNIVDFSDILSNQTQNRKLLSEFEEKFLKYLKKYEEEIKENNNIINFELLLKRFKEVIYAFKNNATQNKNVVLFLDKLNKTLEHKKIELNYIYYVLYFFNSYKLYGKKFLDLTYCDIWLSIELYCTFEESEELKLLDNLLDGIFDVELFEKLKNICKDNTHVKDNYISAYDEFLEYKNSGIPFLYYFKNYIDSYEQEQKDSVKVSDFESGILTPESVYENIKDSVLLYAGLLYSSKDENDDSISNQTAIEIINNLDNMVFKLKNIKEPERTKCLICIRNIWTNKEKYLYEKIENTFNVINVLYEELIINKKNKM